MAKVIETNITLQVNNEIIDFQSRVIKVDNWNSYVDEIKNGGTVVRNSIMGCLSGVSVPRSSRIDNFVCDDFHLSCDIYNYQGIHTKKLAYLAETGKEIVFENGSIIKLLDGGHGNIRGARSKVRLGIMKEYENEFVREMETYIDEKDQQQQT